MRSAYRNCLFSLFLLTFTQSICHAFGPAIDLLSYDPESLLSDKNIPNTGGGKTQSIKYEFDDTLIERVVNVPTNSPNQIQATFKLEAGDVKQYAIFYSKMYRYIAGKSARIFGGNISATGSLVFVSTVFAIPNHPYFEISHAEIGSGLRNRIVTSDAVSIKR